MLPERIQTQRLILRSLDNSDADDVLEYQSHSEVTQFVPWRPRINADGKPGAIIRKTSNFQRKGDALVVGWELQGENKIIGQNILTLTSVEERTANIGWVTNPNYWRNGYAAEATSAVLNQTFILARLNRIDAHIDQRNPNSAALAQRLGMTLEGVFKGASFIKLDSGWCDMWLYSIFAPSGERVKGF